MMDSQQEWYSDFRRAPHSSDHYQLGPYEQGGASGEDMSGAEQALQLWGSASQGEGQRSGGHKQRRSSGGRDHRWAAALYTPDHHVALHPSQKLLS